jgi:hypothetical protein
MRIDLLTIADAANTTPDGKLNILGLGARVLTVDGPNHPIPLVVACGVEATVEEAGDYPLGVRLERPDGVVEDIVMSTLTIPSEVTDPRVPTGAGLTLQLARGFPVPGVYRLAVDVGSLAAEYVFAVVFAADQPAGAGHSNPTDR